MAKRKLVSVSELELNELKIFFNDRMKWGVFTRFEEETKIARSTLSRVLIYGRCELSTIKTIRSFVKSYKPITA
jgi:hypothetical protein